MTNLEFLEFGSPALYALQYGADDLSFEWIFQLLDDIGPHGTAKCELRCVPKNIQTFLSTRQCNFE